MAITDVEKNDLAVSFSMYGKVFAIHSVKNASSEEELEVVQYLLSLLNFAELSPSELDVLVYKIKLGHEGYNRTLRECLAGLSTIRHYFARKVRDSSYGDPVTAFLASIPAVRGWTTFLSLHCIFSNWDCVEEAVKLSKEPNFIGEGDLWLETVNSYDPRYTEEFYLNSRTVDLNAEGVRETLRFLVKYKHPGAEDAVLLFLREGHFEFSEYLVKELGVSPSTAIHHMTLWVDKLKTWEPAVDQKTTLWGHLETD